MATKPRTEFYMKMLKIVGLLATLSVASAAYAQKGTQSLPKPVTPTPPPPVFIADPPPERLTNPPVKPTVSFPKPPPVYAFGQKTLAGRAMVLSPEQAQAIIDQFKPVYAKLESPRLLVCVTRDLAAPVAGGADDPQALADVQLLFSKPLQFAGANLADPNAAAPLIAGKPVEAFTADTPRARKEREALARIADVIIEVVITSKTITLTPGAEGQTVTIPEIQSKAIRLSDSKVLGQAYSTLMTNRIPPAKLTGYDVRELAEPAALALMEQM
jgi:hypothetical protein